MSFNDPNSIVFPSSKARRPRRVAERRAARTECNSLVRDQLIKDIEDDLDRWWDYKDDDLDSHD